MGTGEVSVEEYQDKQGEWRWRIRAANNKILADSGEGYENKEDMHHAFDLIEGYFQDAVDLEV